MWVKGKISCSPRELNIDVVLQCGQSFRWTRSTDHWKGVFADKFWILKQDASAVHYELFLPDDTTLPPNKKFRDDTDSCSESLRDYFQLDVPLVPLYETWSNADPKFKEKAQTFFGVRMLRQDPVENVFSFICSSNNNIQRISSMVEKLGSNYGRKILSQEEKDIFAFPDVSALCGPSVESNLRNLGFGYRAKFIHQSALKIQENGGRDWLLGLRNLPYLEAKKNLMTLPGIGAKVADCICLMSLDHAIAIPVDTHVFQIAKTYISELSAVKSVTDRVYAQISKFFQELYGPYAGWAHTVLFSADLRHLKPKPETPTKNMLKRQVVIEKDIEETLKSEETLKKHVRKGKMESVDMVVSKTSVRTTKKRPTTVETKAGETVQARVDRAVKLEGNEKPEGMRRGRTKKNQ